MAVLSKGDRERLHSLLDKLSTQYPLFSENYPKEIFPLFVTSKQYLQMVDGTLDNPFLPRNKDGCVQESNANFGDHSSDGTDLLAILEDPDELNDAENFWEENEEDTELTDQPSPSQSSQAKSQRKSHMTYQVIISFKRSALFFDLLPCSVYQICNFSRSLVWNQYPAAIVLVVCCYHMEDCILK